MKELKEMEKVYLEEYDVHVEKFLTLAQIQAIVNAVVSLSTPDKEGKIHDTWSEREQCIDMMLLYYATDMSQEIIEETGHDLFVKSGLMNVVRSLVWNLDQIYEALQYTESTQRAVAQIIAKAPEMIKALEGIENKYGNKLKK